MSKKQNASIYGRDLVWVRPHPLEVGTHRLGSEMLMSAKWMLNSVIAAVQQTNPRTGSHVVLREDNPMFDFQPAKLAMEHLGEPANVTILGPEQFDEFVHNYVAGVNNLEALKQVVHAVEKHAPALRFMPKHLHYLLDAASEHPQGQYRHLPRMFLRYDLTDYECLVWLNRSNGQVSPKKLPEWQINPNRILHIGGAWYAFESLDEAVTAKFFAPQTEIHRLREDV